MVDLNLIRPDGWKERLQQDLDFQASFEELDGYAHFYSWTLRSMLCVYQNRFDEALLHSRRSQELFLEVESADPDEQQLHMVNWGARFEAQRFSEITHGTSVAKPSTRTT